MGCGASANAGQLREACLQVDELQKKLAASEAEKGELHRQLKVRQQETIVVESVPASPSGCSKPATKEECPQKSTAGGSIATCPEASHKESDASTEFAAEKDTAKAQQISESGALAEAGSGGKGESHLGTRAAEELLPEASILPGVVCEASEHSRINTEQDDLPALSPCPTQADGAPHSTKESLSHDTLQDHEDANPSGKPSDEAEQLSQAPKAPSGEGQPKHLQPAVSEAKLSGSIGSTASTCTPNANSAVISIPTCHQCALETPDLYLDTSDMNRYCEQCWSDFYGRPPSGSESQPLVGVEVADVWVEDRLAQLWAEHGLPGWPPTMVHSTPSPLSPEGDEWSAVNVRIRREIVGPHAREQSNSDGHPYDGEVLARRYRVRHAVGEGHFTKAFMAEDLQDGGLVCVKRHRNLSVEALADLLVLAKRISDQDEDATMFPRLLGSFYDVVGYTVESLLEGRNCLSIAQSDVGFFRALKNLRFVAAGALEGLVALERAGVVHNDVKPDNLIWTEACAGDQGAKPCVKIVDFGCARLDMREEPVGRNWSLAEGGAGHLGKWSPEMALRLPITHKGDVWGVAISLCELHCARLMWRSEADTAEVILAQALGLCGLTNGLPASLLRRSPLDVRQLYTPAPYHFPVRQNALGQLEALRPTRWGLEQVLGDGWRDGDKANLGELIERALVVDPTCRPCALDLLECCSFVATSDAQGT